MYNHRPLRDFDAPVLQSGMQQAVLGYPHHLLREGVEDGGNRPEIVVLLLVKQMHVYYLDHIVFGI